jgi:DNA-binding response OmpR family regulator
VAYVLVATDADWIEEEVVAALAGNGVTVGRVRAGAHVLPATRKLQPDLVILDLQIGNMGGFASCMAIRHEESMDRLPITAVLMLLDREADVFLAKRADADGWLVKPLDSLKLRRAATALRAGKSYQNGVVPDDDAPAAPAADEPAEAAS